MMLGNLRFKKIAIICVVALVFFGAPFGLYASKDSYEIRLTKHITAYQKYPTSGKLYGLEGDVILRIQIDREGNIVSHMILHKTDHKVLNEAVDEMVKLANPAPKPPENYFKDSDRLVEFMLPIAFRNSDNADDLQKIDRLFQEESLKAWQ